MKVLIVEDEKPAAVRLTRLLREENPDIIICSVLESIEETLEYFAKAERPGLIFMDIQLADGLSFSIFEAIDIREPVIFTTAFDQYALKAFEVNSIDYLLKPVEPERLHKALAKFRSFMSEGFVPPIDYATLISALKRGSVQHKERFLVRKGSKLAYLPTAEVAYFFSDSSLSFLVARNGDRHLIDFNLEKLEELLDPAKFFRINRKCILSLESIRNMEPHFNGRILVDIFPPFDEALYVSRQRAKEFRDWLDS